MANVSKYKNMLNKYDFSQNQSYFCGLADRQFSR